MEVILPLVGTWQYCAYTCSELAASWFVFVLLPVEFGAWSVPLRDDPFDPLFDDMVYYILSFRLKIRKNGPAGEETL